jgi:hypothetical protein
MITKGYSGSRAYAQSQLSQIMFTIDFAEEVREVGITVNEALGGDSLGRLSRGARIVARIALRSIRATALPFDQDASYVRSTWKDFAVMRQPPLVRCHKS